MRWTIFKKYFHNKKNITNKIIYYMTMNIQDSVKNHYRPLKNISPKTKRPSIQTRVKSFK